MSMKQIDQGTKAASVVRLFEDTMGDGSKVYDIRIGNVEFHPVDWGSACTLFNVLCGIVNEHGTTIHGG